MKQVALITGASSGIGRELANVHAQNGGDIVIVSRKESDLLKVKEQIEQQYNTKVYCLAKDLSKVDAAQEIYDQLKAEKIEIEYLINNAGFAGQGYFHERTWADDMAMIQVDVIALVQLVKLYLPEFVKRGSGRILNVSSTAAFMPGGPLLSIYGGSKSFVAAFSRAIATEVEGTGVTVTNLMPGPTESEFVKRANLESTKVTDFKFTPAAIVAKDGYKAMMKGKLDVVSGASWIEKFVISFMPMIFKKSFLKIMKKTQELHVD